MSVPKLRFKEFDGDWSRYKIAEVTEYLVDGTHFSPKTTEGEFKYITSKNIRNDGLDLTNISYISKDEHEKIYKISSKTNYQSQQNHTSSTCL